MKVLHFMNRFCGWTVHSSSRNDRVDPDGQDTVKDSLLLAHKVCMLLEVLVNYCKLEYDCCISNQVFCGNNLSVIPRVRS